MIQLKDIILEQDLIRSANDLNSYILINKNKIVTEDISETILSKISSFVDMATQWATQIKNASSKITTKIINTLKNAVNYISKLYNESPKVAEVLKNAIGIIVVLITLQGLSSEANAQSTDSKPGNNESYTMQDTVNSAIALLNQYSAEKSTSVDLQFDINDGIIILNDIKSKIESNSNVDEVKALIASGYDQFSETAKNYAKSGLSVMRKDDNFKIYQKVFNNINKLIINGKVIVR